MYEPAVVQRVAMALREYWRGCSEIAWEEAATTVLDAVNTPKPTVTLDLPDQPFALEVAAGERPTDGFIHNDARPLDHIEIVSDAREELVNIVGTGRVSHLRACHVLEHFPYNETVNVLARWRTLLVSNGTIHLELPNLSWQVGALTRGEISPQEFVYYAYGEQNYTGNFHFAAFTEDLLRERLEQAGYTSINVVDIGQVLVATATA